MGNIKRKPNAESSDEFCKRLGIRIVNEKGGMEFVPYRGPQKAIKPVSEQQKISKQRAGFQNALRKFVLRSGSSFHNHWQMCTLNIARGRW